MTKFSRAKLAQGFVQMLTTHSHKDAVRALAVQVMQQRLTSQLDLLVQDICREYLRVHGHLNAEVVTARTLSSKILDDVKDILQAKTGAKSITLSQVIDPSIHGGLIARTADVEFDLSIASKLKQLEV